MCGTLFGAQDWIRTSTPLRALRPEHSASTNFATWASLIFRSGRANIGQIWKTGIQKIKNPEILERV